MRHSRFIRRGNVAVIVVGVIVVAFSMTLLFMKQSREKYPFTLLQMRYVAADIADFQDFQQRCGEMNEDSVVTMRDEPNGNCLFVKVHLRQDYIYEMGREQGVWNSIQADDFRLSTDKGDATAILLLTGYSDEKDQVERLVLPSVALYREKDTGKIMMHEHPAFASEQKIEDEGLGAILGGIRMANAMSSMGGRVEPTPFEWLPPSLEERLAITQPPGLKENIWQACKAYEAEDAWVGLECVLLFPTMPPGSTGKLYFAGDENTAIPVTLP